MSSVQSLGGQATAKILRTKALTSYYASPNFCLQCLKVISVAEHDKVPSVRKKKFCNRSCAARYNNVHFPKRTSTTASLKPFGTCGKCGVLVSYKQQTAHSYRTRKYCDICASLVRSKLDKLLRNETKFELYRRHGWQTANTIIRKHARKVYAENNTSRQCAVCGYSNHIQVSHKKKVCDFPDSTVMSDINQPDNLVGLCPNHHWELDNGILVL